MADAVDPGSRAVAWSLDAAVVDRLRVASERVGLELVCQAGVDADADADVEDDVDVEAEIVVVDGSTPDWLGRSARLTRRRPGVRVMLIGDLAGPEEFVSALVAGVVGFCPAAASAEVIERSVRSLVDSGVAIPREYAKPLVEAARHGRGRSVHTAAGDVSVTEREWEILQMLVQRRSTREMAETLFVSPGTVRTHVSAVLRKLGAIDRADVVTLVGHGPD